MQILDEVGKNSEVYNWLPSYNGECYQMFFIIRRYFYGFETDKRKLYGYDF